MREGWEYKKLGEVCQILMGQSPAGNSINENEGIEFHQGKTCFGDRYLGVSPLFSKSPLRLAEPNSVLLCVRAPVGFPNITDRQVCIGRGLCSLKVEELLDNNFLYYSLLGKQSYFEKNATGSTFKAISSKVVSNTLIAIPSKEVQLDIVSELDQINDLIRLKKEQLKEYDNLAQSIFYDMFGDPMVNEKGWEVKALGDVSTIITGNTPSRRILEYYNDDFIEWIKSDNISDEAFYPTKAKEFLSEKGMQKGRVANNGDILVTCIAGSISSVGTSCVLNRSVAFNQQINAITKLQNVDAFFLRSLIKYSKKYFQEYATTGMKHIISKSVFESISIPLPPLPLQQEFSSRIEQIENLKTEVQKTITDLETLLASRMQYWFE